ncbi:MAG: DUF3427 domain-containing protein [Pelosinus sp.]|nr:DUF3427 domain-containing protein [Pelosinus sp.]
MLKCGIYEQIINRVMDQYISCESVDHLYQFETEPVDSEEAAVILSKYMTEVIEHGLKQLKDYNGDLTAQIKLVNQLIDTIVNSIGYSTEDKIEIKKQLIASRGEILLAVSKKQNNLTSIKQKSKISRPVTSISQSSLFTGAAHEPSMFMELKKEILSSNRIDMLVSFIKWSGLRLLYEELKEFTMNGGQLRVITTSYMGATDVKAVEMLRELSNTEIKISYDTKRTRLHAKAYLFVRENGFTTAYIGSSNLSNAAISSGLEWNVKVTNKDLPATINKIEGTFNAYWNDREFRLYEKNEKVVLMEALNAEKFQSANHLTFNFEIRPYDYQKEILEKLQAERDIRGYYKNLVVAATGTGKTVISAFDYKNFCHLNPNKANRLLFIAHREEILKQSIACFRGVLRNQNFGDLYVGNFQPESIEHLFLSVQTFTSKDFASFTSCDFYDYIVVDEFHHAAAATYQKLLTYYNPKILLGLTATPERMDGKDILTWFDNRIAAEIRLPEAIDRKLLCPFQYFGVTDDVDLSQIRWTKGGYDKVELQNVYTGNKRRAELIVRSLNKYVTDIEDVKGLGFCVSVDHAVFMADFFNACHIKAIALTSDSPDNIRGEAKEKLASGEIKFIFVVDLYNEGVDIPEVNTILFLRPTESLTVFLQQLGRGLRLYKDKECLTVLDFIGQANKRYNFADKITALLTNTHKGIEREIREGLLNLPRGSFITLEKYAKEYILRNIRASYSSKAGLISRLETFSKDTGKELSYQNFFEYYHLDLASIYPAYSFARLCVYAGLREDFTESLEETMARAFSRLCTINSRRWIAFLLKVLPKIEQVSANMLSSNEKSMVLMLYYTIYQNAVEGTGFNGVLEAISALKQCPVMFTELIELLNFNFGRIDFVDKPVDMGFPSPLDLHCTYSTAQILAAVGYYNEEKMPAMREGVKYLAEKNLDIFFITLNKSDKDYSPTTLYDDYSINEVLFHWQSQNRTSDESTTGQRYINHKQRGGRIALFVREYKTSKAGASPYTFLGLADYISHTGSRPMSITWRLREPIPANFLKKTNKLIVG